MLLNNDVVVTDGWLDQLIGLVNAKRLVGEPESGDPRPGKAAVPTPPGPPFTRGGKVLAPPSVDGTADETGNLREADPSVPTAYCLPPSAGCAPPTANCPLATVPTIGLVGPMSNYASPPQRVEGVPYRDLHEMHAFARRSRDAHRGKWFTARKLSGFCLLIVRKLYALIARVHPMTGNSQEALRTCAAGLKLDPKDAELWHRKGVIHRHRGESSEAERSWRRILELKRPEKYCSFDDGLYGHITWRNLAHLAAERGDQAEAIRLWEAVLAECRGDREALAKLGRGPTEDGAGSARDGE